MPPDSGSGSYQMSPGIFHVPASLSVLLYLSLINLFHYRNTTYSAVFLYRGIFLLYPKDSPVSFLFGMDPENRFRHTCTQNAWSRIEKFLHLNPQYQIPDLVSPVLQVHQAAEYDNIIHSSAAT